MKKVLSVCLAILMVFAVFQGAVFAEDEEYNPDDRYLWIGVLPQDLGATNYLLSYFLSYINSDYEGKDDPQTILDIGGYSDDWIKEMLFGLIEGEDPRNWLIIGDVDMDDKVTASDARKALCMAVGFYSFYSTDSITFMAADVDRNGEVSAADARAILRVAVELDKF